MRKLAKLLTVAVVVAAAGTFFTLNSANEIICGNIEALTGGDTWSSGPMASVVDKGRKPTEEELKKASSFLGTGLSMGCTSNSYGTHTLDGTEYYDCGINDYGYVIYDGNNGKCIYWYVKEYMDGKPVGSRMTSCPEHP